MFDHKEVRPNFLQAMVTFCSGDFHPIVSFIEVVTASFFMVAQYGYELMKMNFAQTVAFYVADALRTKTISFELLTRSLDLDSLEKRYHAYGMWPISSSHPPLPCDTTLFMRFLQLNNLPHDNFDEVLFEDAELYVEMKNEVCHTLYLYTQAAGMDLSFEQFTYQLNHSNVLQNFHIHVGILIGLHEDPGSNVKL
jgi:hypothetical protein